MSRKKDKQTRKYQPRDEFRVNNSPVAGGHPNYVFGETKTKYKSVGLTTNPKEEIKSYPLSKNPNPKDNRQSYIQDKVLTTRKDFMKKKLDGWKFAKSDKAIARHIKKKYKKSTNRKKNGKKKR